MRRKMLTWSKSNNLWKRRTSIICQLGFKSETDFELMYACIEPSLGSREFFLQKAIGWALRQYAWTEQRRDTEICAAQPHSPECLELSGGAEEYRQTTVIKQLAHSHELPWHRHLVRKLQFPLNRLKARLLAQGFHERVGL